MITDTNGFSQTASRLWRVLSRRWVGIIRIMSRGAAASIPVARPGRHVARRRGLAIGAFAVSIFGGTLPALDVIHTPGEYLALNLMRDSPSLCWIIARSLSEQKGDAIHIEIYKETQVQLGTVPRSMP